MDEHSDLGPINYAFNGELADAGQISLLEERALHLTDKLPYDSHREYSYFSPDGTIVVFRTDHQQSEENPDGEPTSTHPSLKLAHGSEDNTLLHIKFKPNNEIEALSIATDINKLAQGMMIRDPDRSYSDTELATLAYLEELALHGPTPGSELVQRTENHTDHIADILRLAVTDNTYYDVRKRVFFDNLGDNRLLRVVLRSLKGLHQIDSDTDVMPRLEITLDDVARGNRVRYHYERLRNGYFDLDSFPLPMKHNQPVVNSAGEVILSQFSVDSFRKHVGLKQAGKEDVERLSSALFVAATQTARPISKQTDTI